MILSDLKDCFERSPVIAAVQKNNFSDALESPCELIFHLNMSITDAKDNIEAAHMKNKKIFAHIDLAEGIGKDKAGIEYLASLGIDGIISTRAQFIRFANDMGLATVQRFFALDSKGVESISDMLENTKPCLIEIMPGIIGKVIAYFSKGNIPVIAGGLIETKAEALDALKNGAEAVSTGKKELWYL